MIIREYKQKTDYEGLKRCVISVQDFEREIDPRMPRGIEIVEMYVPDLLRRCQKHQGKILVADVEGAVAGYVLILCKVVSEELDDGDLEFGLVGDLVVLEEFRNKGYGRELLSAAENEAKAFGVKWLRIGALNSNRFAYDLYMSKGYHPHSTVLEKTLIAGPD